MRIFTRYETRPVFLDFLVMIVAISILHKIDMRIIQQTTKLLYGTT